MSKLEQILQTRKTQKLLFEDKYSLDYKYSPIGYLKLLFGATAIPEKVIVYNKKTREKLGVVKRDSRLFKLAY
jgi:hypothetical protein